MPAKSGTEVTQVNMQRAKIQTDSNPMSKARSQTCRYTNTPTEYKQKERMY